MTVRSKSPEALDQVYLSWGAGQLPMPPTPLVGRERELAEAGSLLRRPEVRLVTLTGPGGVGKTRLAMEIAAEHAHAFADGVRAVALDAIGDPARVPLAIAQALGVRGDGDSPPVATVAEHIGDRSLLLVLDNFESVAEAAPVVAQLLETCRGLKVLATSRSSLDVRAEHAFPVGPLAVDVPGRHPDEIVTSPPPAVALFVERARAASPSFELTGENASVVAKICASVDGLPLAIELAAAHIKVLPPDAMLQRLHSRLDFLDRGPRDLPARHRTMRDAIAWSHDLLDSREQALFRRAAIFVGGFTPEAAEVIVGQEASVVLGGLSSLVSQNLVSQSAIAGQPRFRMLETIREYGLERLDVEGEAGEMRQRHARWCLACAEAAEPELVRFDQRRWLDRLEAEQDNMRSALEWSLVHGEPEIGLRLAAALWRYWSTRGDLREGYDWLERALAGGTRVADAVRGKALHRLGNLAIDRGEYGAARANYQASLAIRRRQGDAAEMAEPLNGLGLLAFHEGDYADAERLHQESLRLRRSAADTHGTGNSLVNLGDVASAQGDYQRAEALYGEALAIRRELGHTGGIAYCLFNLGDIAWGRGDHVTARSRFEGALSLFREVGDRLGVGYALHSLGRVAHAEGDVRRAASRYGEALPLRQELGDTRGVIECVEGVAAVIGGESGERAIALLAAADTLRMAHNAPLKPADRATQRRLVTAIRVKIGRVAFDRAWADGTLRSLDEVVTEATALAALLAADDPILPAGLSQREAEVLRLVAAGLTNAQIADRLYLSPHTVSAHLRRIYGKLDVTSRSAATRFALDNGLA